MDRREELIVELLRLTADPAALTGMEGVRGDSGTVPIRTHGPQCRMRYQGLKCTCWVKSLDELTRCLRVMRGVERQLWYAVTERYVMAERRPRQVRVRRFQPLLEANQEPLGLVIKTDLDKRGDGECRILVETWRSTVRDDRVGEGLRWLAKVFVGQPQVPVELLDKAAA